MRKLSRKERQLQAERNAKMLAAEAAFEIEMNDRIITESALIREEWSEQERASRMVAKSKPLEIRQWHVPEQWG
jgi:hypothetical protein